MNNKILIATAVYNGDFFKDKEILSLDKSAETQVTTTTQTQATNFDYEAIYSNKIIVSSIILLIVLFIVLFVVSIVDSIYQRCRIISILKEFEVVEEVVTETYEMNADGHNNYIGGDNNGEINNENN